MKRILALPPAQAAQEASEATAARERQQASEALVRSAPAAPPFPPTDISLRSGTTVVGRLPPAEADVGSGRPSR